MPTVDDIVNYLFRIKELQNWIDNVMFLMCLQPLIILTMQELAKDMRTSLPWGVFEDASYDPKKRLLPRGAIFAGFPKVHEAKPEDLTEHTT